MVSQCCVLKLVPLLLIFASTSAGAGDVMLLCCRGALVLNWHVIHDTVVWRSFWGNGGVAVTAEICERRFFRFYTRTFNCCIELPLVLSRSVSGDLEASSTPGISNKSC